MAKLFTKEDIRDVKFHDDDTVESARSQHAWSQLSLKINTAWRSRFFLLCLSNFISLKVNDIGPILG